MTLSVPTSSSSTPRPSALSSKRSASGSSSTTSGGHSGGLGAKIAHLLPRHAQFNVRLHIHELSSVPLVHGAFAARWRFRHVRHSHTAGSSSGSSGGVFAKMRSSSGPWASSPNLAPGAGASAGAMGSVGRRWKGKGRAVAREEPAEEIGTRPNRVPSANGIIINVVDATSDDHRSSVDEVPGGHEDPEHEDGHHYPYATTGFAASSSSLHSLNGEQAGSGGRGQTSFVSLVDHTASWEQSVDVVVQMGVTRDTGALLPNELKIVIQQQVTAGDLDSPRNPRLGAVHLNLAEYADKGPVTRKYLLRESKTNALLKLTIELQHIGGEKHYVAPPLRKGEVMAGITGLLASDKLRSTPLPFVDPAPALASHQSSSSSSLSGSGSTPSLRVPSITSSSGTPFASSRITDSGASTTRDLIEALFNPAPSADDAPSPFTYFDPTAPADDAASAADSASVSEAHSVDTTSSAAPAASLASTSPSASQTSRHHWWRARPRRRQTEYPELRDAPGPQPPTLSSTTRSGGIIRVSSPLPIGGSTTVHMGSNRSPPRERPPLLSSKTGSEGFVTVTASTA